MFKPGFFGKNPPRWFIGQVPLDQTENKTNVEGWSDRVKVRIMGYHPAEGSILEDKDLPWAIMLRPSTHGSLNKMSTGIVGGEWVVGIFIDDDYEKPMIIGVLGRTDPSYTITGSQVKSNKSSEFKKTSVFITPPKYQILTNPDRSSQTNGENIPLNFFRP
jgi:hypothetical protein